MLSYPETFPALIATPQLRMPLVALKIQIQILQYPTIMASLSPSRTHDSNKCAHPNLLTAPTPPRPPFQPATPKPTIKELLGQGNQIWVRSSGGREGGAVCHREPF